jgi:hypothetical protein
VKRIVAEGGHQLVKLSAGNDARVVIVVSLAATLALCFAGGAVLMLRRNQRLAE